ncbi:hypothetical protein [Spongiivirga citrea]|uniref:Uncharacterized protein n=1 Tax=Spongiivirga citrea TaxID=1481457 RepID=A0A6M0CJ07_9FLAO|nr:hypothetical protein [Spongiivirga citrea]NER17928.1 hypothetical protein [Spongiivirga citrea]
MKTKFLSIALMVFGFLFATAGTPLNNFNGTWKNVNARTRGITKVIISGNGASPYLQIFGSCSPKDCDWGRKKSTAYSNSVNGNVRSNSEYLSADFSQGFANRKVLVKMSGSTMVVTTFTTFKNGDRRSNYATTEKFKKAPRIKLPSPTITTCAKEDLLSLNPKGSLKVKKNSKGTYSVVQGSRYLFSAPNVKEANQIIKIVRRYGFNSSGFVGRPDPSFTYQLCNKRASNVKPLKSEDIIAFDPSKVKVSFVRNRWKIVEGNHYIFDFGKSKKEAEEALCIIKKYKFNGVGYVGRPNASFQYMVKR